ncbi:glycosyltransferase family 39 protein [bacterium]|jgi:4-amino-4-deoxy-L-arabinose transferase-like glycosyltransferase|nr:glycosyltransferase family 39 protein [bacterium]
MGFREKIVLFFYTLFNVIANQFISVYSDETYYWLWSKKLDFSYFDHPPMVAYLIKLTTLFSDEPMFLRLSAALLVSATAYFLYRLAKKIFDEKAAVYTFYIYISSLLVIAASTIIAPDIPLMFFWTLTLYCAYIYLEEDNKKYALLTGLSAGAMLLSKYTGILPLFTLFVYILLYRRAVFKDRYFYGAIVLALIVFSPVLYWNYQHDFISFTFQFEHGVAEEKHFNPGEFFSFIGAQLALFHPFYLLPLLYFIVRDKERFSQKKVYLLLPFLFVLGFFSYNAAFKEANEQWAAGAYLSGAVLLGYYFAKYDLKKLLFAALALSAIVMIGLKTPLGLHYVKPIKNMRLRLGHIDKFKSEIEAMKLDMSQYDYLLIDDYHGSEVAYFFRLHDNVLVLDNARFSNFNIWRKQEAGVAMETPLKSIPSLGKCLYIGRNKHYVDEIAALFGNSKLIAHEQKVVGNWNLDYYFVEFNN